MVASNYNECPGKGICSSNNISIFNKLNLHIPQLSDCRPLKKTNTNLHQRTIFNLFLEHLPPLEIKILDANTINESEEHNCYDVKRYD